MTLVGYTFRLAALLALLLFLVVVLFIIRHQGKSAATSGGDSTSFRESTRSIVSAGGQFITLDPSGRYLINSVKGRPVFITGDAAWSLMTQLDNADVEIYLSDRASRGFNYVWCGAADNYYQSNAPKNYYGHAPFDGADFTSEDADYWSHVDYVIRRAAAYGITVGLSPGFVGLNSPGGYLASYLNSSDDVLTAYGAFLGNRYQGFPNLIWALGGDVDPQTGVLPKLTALASGIRSKDKVHLMVAEGHPRSTATQTFSQATWMDLDWVYLHTFDVLAAISSNNVAHSLPSFLGEGWYENEHGITEFQLREQEYWAVLGGAFLGNGGFGNRPLWYFNGGPDAQPGEPPWQNELGSLGSLAQTYLGRLFRSREHWKMVPDTGHTVMTAGYDSRGPLSSVRESIHGFLYRVPYRLGDTSSVAARTSDGQTIIAYVPNGSMVTIDMTKILDPQKQAKCWWFDPRNGTALPIGSFSTTGPKAFTPPDASDWVLVVDSSSAHLAAPGSKDL